MIDDQLARVRKLEIDHQDTVAQQLIVQGEQIALRRMTQNALGSLGANVDSIERQVNALVKRFDDNVLADILDRDRQRTENSGRLGRMESKVTILILAFLLLAIIGLLIIGYLWLRLSL